MLQQVEKHLQGDEHKQQIVGAFKWDWVFWDFFYFLLINKNRFSLHYIEGIVLYSIWLVDSLRIGQE